MAIKPIVVLMLCLALVTIRPAEAQQRSKIHRIDPEVVLMDEPFANLDAQINPLRAGARLVNHLRRHVGQPVNLFYYLPIVSRGILAGELFPYS